MKVTLIKENGVYEMHAEGIKTPGDVKEAIFQLEQIGKQMQGGFAIEEGRISSRVTSSEINAITSSAPALTTENVFVKGRFVSTTDDIKESLVIDSSNTTVLSGPIPVEGRVTFSKLDLLPLCIPFISPSTGEKLGELKEKDGVLTFEGNADESAKLFFDEMIKQNINPKK